MVCTNQTQTVTDIRPKRLSISFCTIIVDRPTSLETTIIKASAKPYYLPSIISLETILAFHDSHTDHVLLVVWASTIFQTYSYVSQKVSQSP